MSTSEKRRVFGTLALLIFVLGVVGFIYAMLMWKTSLVPGVLPLRQLAEPTSADRILVFSPHEDDETLGCAGYMHHALEAGAQVYVCFMTNGEGEELGAVWATRSLHLTPAKFVRLGMIRQREARRTMSRLGIPPDHVFFLGYPNNGLDRLWSADYWDPQHLFTSAYTRTQHSPYPGGVTPATPFCGSQVLSDVTAVINRVRPTIIFTLHPADVHRDHWATYCFVQLAVQQLAGTPADAWVSHVPVYCYLVHRPDWPVPFGYVPTGALRPPASLATLPVNQWLTFPLTQADEKLKNSLILDYRSQAARFDWLLHSFVRRNELFAEIKPIPLTAEGLPETADLDFEPTCDCDLLRDRPYADITSAGVEATHGWLEAQATTARDIRRRTPLTILLHLPNPPPGAPRVLEARGVPGQPVELVSATDHRRLPNPSPYGLQAVFSRNVARLNVPLALLQSSSVVLLDALTTRGRRNLDHSVTRTVILPPVLPGSTHPASLDDLHHLASLAPKRE